MTEKLREELFLYNILRQVFLKEPTKELIEDLSKLTTPDWVDNDIDLGLKLMIESCKNNLSRKDEWLEDLAVEYSRLLIGLKEPLAVPFGSYYLSDLRSLMTDETIEVRKKYLEVDLALKDLYSIPDDHIGIELEFVFYLTYRIIENWERNNKAEFSRLFELREDFITRHMRLWIPQFAEKIVSYSRENFFTGAALILRGLFSL